MNSSVVIDTSLGVQQVDVPMRSAFNWAIRLRCPRLLKKAGIFSF